MSLERSIAERAYAYNKKSYETKEEREWRYVKLYNSIFRNITNVKTSKDYLQVMNQISAFKAETKDMINVSRLNKLLKEQLKNVENELQNKMAKLNDEVENIKNDRLVESAETLRDLQTQSDMFLLELLAKLRTDETYNRRYIGSVLANANRPQALAILKLNQMEPYKKLLSEKQKESALLKSKSTAVLIYNKHKEEQIERLNKELSSIYMQAFHLRTAQRQISNSDDYYFEKE